MENRRAILISLICFVVSLTLIIAYVEVKKGELTSEFGDEVDVVVTTEDIPEYAIIRKDQLQVVKVFKAFRQPQTVTDPAEIIGKAAFVPLYKAEQVTLTKLVHQDGRPVLDRQVEKKTRALTIQISSHTGVGRLIRPGNRVDIIATPNYDSGNQSIYEIKTVIQNVLVLATGKTIQNAVPTRVSRDVLGAIEAEFESRRRKDFTSPGTDSLNTSRPDDNYTHITVQLKPEEAEKIMFLTHAFGDNRLYFTLRNSADMEVVKLDTTLLDDVLGPNSDYGLTKRKPPPMPPPRPPRFYDSQGGKAVPIY